MSVAPFRTLCLLVACATLLNGCGKQSGDKNSPRTISLWHFWSEPKQEAALKTIVAEYERTHPGTAVQLTALSWNEGKTKLLAAFNSGTVPDVVELGSDWVAQFSSSGVLTDLTSGFSTDTSIFTSSTLAPGLWNGTLFAMPWVIDTRVMFYNKELMARAGLDSSTPPATWADLQMACDKIVSLGGGVFGFGANASDAHRLYKKVLPFFWGNGGDVLSADGKQCVINSDQNKIALNVYLRLTSTGMLETQKQLDAEFALGVIGFWFSGGWLIEKIRAEHPDLHYGIALMPQPAAGVGSRASFAGGEYLAVPRAAKESGGAVDLVRYLTTGTNALAFCKQVTEAGYPADRHFQSDRFFTDDAHRRIFIAQLAAARFTPVHPQWLDIEKIIEDEVVEAMYGRKTAEQALDEARAEIDNVLARR